MAKKAILQIPISKFCRKSESVMEAYRLASGRTLLGPIFLRVLGLRHSAENI